MSAEQPFPDVSGFAQHLRQLRSQRQAAVHCHRGARPSRQSLTKALRAVILSKAGGRCHICGGPIAGQDWEADHVFAHSAGGAHSADNFLPAHSLCNNYRWHYGTEEFQWILKLGVWLRTHIEKQTSLGIDVGAKFVAHDRRRAARRRPALTRL
jgi:5-methylcytosine-specific restriction endonuclease McrA